MLFADLENPWSDLGTERNSENIYIYSIPNNFKVVFDLWLNLVVIS
jgi:hypothetical protein